MKRKGIILLFLLTLMLATLLFSACDDPDNPDNPSATTFVVDFVVDNLLYDSVEVEEGGLATPNKAVPTKKGYTFEGWYTENTYDTKWDLSADKVTAETNLYAKWERNEYTITYHNVGDISNPNPTGYNVESNKITLEGISKHEHVFGGWYSDAALTKKITEISKGTTGNLDIYAKLTSFFKSGTGTESDPYVLSTKFHLENLRSKVEKQNINGNRDSDDVYAKLDADIDLGGAEWTPIRRYYGSFDGCGYKISNYKITSGANLYSGLFGEFQGTLKNLGVVNFSINVSRIGNSNFEEVVAGGLVGKTTDAIVENCYAKGSIKGSSTGYGGKTGGLIGNSSVRYNNESITENCYAEVDVSMTTVFGGEVYAGGLIGSGGDNEIKNCYATGNITAKSSRAVAGGLCGSAYGEITNCFASGTVVATASSWGVHAGGLVGISGSKLITNCYASGAVTATKTSINTQYPEFNVLYVGGLAGSANADVTNCYATGAVTAISPVELSELELYFGGLVGYNFGREIENCYASGILGAKFDKVPIGLSAFQQLLYAAVNYKSSEFGIGNIVGYVPYAPSVINCHYYPNSDYGILTGNAGEITQRVESDFESETFYTDTLLWSEDDWDFSGTLSYSSGPKLKVFA